MKILLLISTLLFSPLLSASDNLDEAKTKIKSHLLGIQNITSEYLNSFPVPHLEQSKDQIGIQTVTQQIKETSKKLGTVLSRVSEKEKKDLKEMEDALATQDQSLIYRIALSILNTRLNETQNSTRKTLVELSGDNPSEFARKYGIDALRKSGESFALTKAKIALLTK